MQGQDNRVELHLWRIESLSRHRLRDPMDVFAGLRDRDAGLQPAGRVEAVRPMVRARRIDLQRQPHHGGTRVREVRRQREVRGHDPDHLERRAVDLNRAADDGGIAGVAALPEAVADHREVGTAGHVLLRGEAASAKGRDAERREHVRADVADRHALGLAVARQVRLAIAPGGHFGQRRRPAAVVEDFSLGDPRLVERGPAAPDHDGAIRVAPRQRSQQDGVDDAEDRGVRADAERERQHGDGGERGIPRKRADAEPEILCERVEPGGGHRDSSP